MRAMIRRMGIVKIHSGMKKLKSTPKVRQSGKVAYILGITNHKSKTLKNVNDKPIEN